MGSKSDNTPEVDSKEDLVYLYKWYVEFYNEKDTKTKIYPLSMDKFMIMNDYKNANIPVITARMRLKLKDIIKLKDWQKSCMVSITCKRHDMQKTGTGSYKELNSTIDFSTTLVPIFNSKTFKEKYDKEDIEERDNKSSAADLNVDSASVNMILLDPTSTNALKTMFCQVVAPGNTVGTVMQWMFSEMPVTGVIVDPPDNSGEQPAILIPPMSFTQAMNHLQSVYGIYENGLLIYYDIDGNLYVLDKYSTEHEHEKDVSNLTKLYMLDASESTVGNTVRLKKKSSDDAQYTGVIILTYVGNEVLDGEMMGNTLIFSSFQQGIDAVTYEKQKVKSSTAKDVAMALTRNKKTNELTGTKAMADYDELNNMYNMSSYFNEIESTSNKYIVELKNCVMTDFKPNTIIEMEFEDTTKNNEQSGKYFLNKAMFSFSRIKTADQNKIIDDSEDIEKYGYTPSTTSCTCELEVSRRYPD